MKKLLLAGLVGLSIVSLAGCGATAGNRQLAKETNESIQEKIVKGKTNKSDIKGMLGDPTGIGFTSEKQEQWTYSFANTRVNGKTFIPFYGIFAGGATTKLKQLVIIFDGDVVENYVMSDSITEARNGG